MGRCIYKKTILVLMTLLLFTMIGCGKKEEVVTVLPEDVTYEETEIALKGIKGEIAQYCMEKEVLYILTKEDTVNHFYTAKADGSNCVELPLDLTKGEMISSFAIAETGNIFCLTAQGEEETQMELVKFDANGAEVLRENITDSLQLAGNNLIPKIIIDNTGNIILASGEYAYILDSKLQTVGKVETKNKYTLVDLACTKGGQVIFARSKESGSQMIGDLCLLDCAEKKWSSTIEGNKGFCPEQNCLIDGLDYDIYCKNGAGIYGYSIEEKAWKGVLDARYSFLTSDDVSGMLFAGDKNFFSIFSDVSETDSNIVMKLYSKLNREELAGKQTITIGAYNLSSNIRKIAKKFNKQNEDYRIEVRLYEDEEQTRLLMDILAGDAPDIIYISSLMVSSNQLVSNGILEDLTPYYEKDSKTYTKDLISPVLEGMKIENKLYSVAPFFSISSAVGRTSDVGNGTGWTFDEMKAALAKKGEDVVPFMCDEKSQVLDAFLQNGMGDFINWNTGECSFDSQEFKDILELCNSGKADTNEELSDEEIVENVEEALNKMAEGKVLLINDTGVNLESIQSDMQRLGGDITYIGYPNKEKQGSYFVYPEEYGIYSGSKVKDKAWEFLRMILSEDYQNDAKRLAYYMMPINQTCFDWKVKAQMATEPYVDEYGQTIEPLEIQTYEVGGVKIKSGPISQKEVDIFVDLMNHTTKKVTFDEEMLDIVYEESQAYFKGAKSLDETADIIQNRISTYVNEKR